MSENIKSYRDLIVWQKAMDLVTEVYGITDFFPSEERFGLISQLRRCSVSIPSNIAEGRGRGTRKDFIQFLRISLGSSNELATQIEIAKRLPKTKNLEYTKIDLLLEEVVKMLNAMILKLSINN